MSIETNCFRIEGLDALRPDYRLFEIIGLTRESPDYYGNIQRMVKQLSFQMRAPVTTYEQGTETFLVLPQRLWQPTGPH